MRSSAPCNYFRPCFLRSICTDLGDEYPKNDPISRIEYPASRSNFAIMDMSMRRFMCFVDAFGIGRTPDPLHTGHGPEGHSWPSTIALWISLGVLLIFGLC